ncbi:MAG: hypothetical protein WC505_06310 [Patescibacteria group bacterium]
MDQHQSRFVLGLQQLIDQTMLNTPPGHDDHCLAQYLDAILQQYRAGRTAGTVDTARSDLTLPPLWSKLLLQYGLVAVPSPEGNEEQFAHCGNTIFIGNIKDPEIRNIAFFHELGHAIMSDSPYQQAPTKLAIEHEAWRIGLRLAAQHGITDWSIRALSWAKQQLSSYLGYEK